MYGQQPYGYAAGYAPSVATVPAHASGSYATGWAAPPWAWPLLGGMFLGAELRGWKDRRDAEYHAAHPSAAAGYGVGQAMIPYVSGARGGAYVDLQQWARSNPDFLAWAKAQGSGWTGLLESLGEVSPDHWSYLAKAYSVQMNYMAQRWPNGMALLNAELAAGYNAPAYNPPTYGAGASPGALDPAALAAQRADTQWLLKAAQVQQGLQAMKGGMDQIAACRDPSHMFDCLPGYQTTAAQRILDRLKSIAGNAVNSLAPALDALTQGASKPGTQQAWQMNRQLSAVALPVWPGTPIIFPERADPAKEGVRQAWAAALRHAWSLVDAMYNTYDGAFAASQRSSAAAGWAQHDTPIEQIPSLNQMLGLIQQGKQRLVYKDYVGALDSFRRAGDLGVSVVGPEIDIRTHGASKGVTTSAWYYNADLAKAAASPSPDNAWRANILVHNMFNEYLQYAGSSLIREEATAGNVATYGYPAPGSWRAEHPGMGAPPPLPYDPHHAHMERQEMLRQGLILPYDPHRGEHH